MQYKFSYAEMYEACLYQVVFSDLQSYQVPHSFSSYHIVVLFCEVVKKVKDKLGGDVTKRVLFQPKN